MIKQKQQRVKHWTDWEDIWSQTKTKNLDLNIFDMHTVDTKTILESYLRHYRGSPISAKACHAPASPHQKIDLIRECLKKNNLPRATSLLTSGQNEGDPIEATELLLEKVKLLNISKNYSEAWELAHHLSENGILNRCSLLTLEQQKGHSAYGLKLFSQAEAILKNILRDFKDFTNQESYFQSHSFLVLVLSEQGNFDEAKSCIDELEVLIQSIENQDCKFQRCLQLSRSLFHWYRLQNRPREASEHLYDANIIADWTGQYEVLERIQREMQDFPNPRQMTNPHQGNGWIYLEYYSVLLDRKNHKLYSIQKNELIKKIIKSLSFGPLPVETFFQKVWGLSYDPARHYQHVRSTLSNMKRIFPIKIVKLKQGHICLE